ncbi:MAG: SDR family NAD(P)-dependent oxidoreductase [Bacteroidales bacterium]|nr:SDR family NAD(P)-dependent oxidoreductase [Bacteroidales bacterium]
MKLSGQNILITGGASGIGRLIGRLAIEKGARSIVIWDINPQSIEKVAAEHRALAAGKTQIEGFRVDVSDNACVTEAYAQTVAAVGQVDVLVNCAGIVTSNKPFSQNTPSEIDRTIKVNTIAPMYVALAAINDMIARDHGHICTIASAAGMLSNPNMSIYAASKWGAIGWSDSVRIELQKAKSHVHITTVAPYYINTGMFDGVQSRIIPILDPEKTAKKIVRAIEKDKDFRGIPFSFHFIRFFQGLLPTFFFDWFFGEVFGVYHTMDHFTGRKN